MDGKGARGKGAKSDDMPAKSVNVPLAVVVSVLDVNAILSDVCWEDDANDATTWTNCVTECCSAVICCWKSGID